MVYVFFQQKLQCHKKYARPQTYVIILTANISTSLTMTSI